MHRQRTRLAARVRGHAQPVAKAVERSGIVATYALHDRLLSNRSSRRKHDVHPPELDEVQRRILAAVDREGYATVPFDELVSDPSPREAAVQPGAEVIPTTERGLRERPAQGPGPELG